METITQRQLRNDNASVIRRVENGERFVVTKRGKPVATVGPYDADVFEQMVIRHADPGATLPARVQPGDLDKRNGSVPEHLAHESIQDSLDYLRGER